MTAEIFRPCLQARRCLTFAIISVVAAAPSVAAAGLLSSTVVRNSSVYSSTELFATYRSFTGKPVDKETASVIAEAVREMYRADGYSRPGFTIADDGQKSGIIRIELNEPQITAIRFSGDSGPYRERLEALFADVPKAESMRPAEIRSVVQRARRLPGLQLGISTKPDETGSGGFLLEVDSEFQRYGGSLTLSNRGTRQIGRNLAFLNVYGNGMFGAENSAGLFLASAEDADNYSSGGIFLQSAIGAGGMTGNYQGSIMSVQFETSGFIVDQNRERHLLKISSRPRDWNGRRLSAWAGLEIDNIDVEVNNIATRADRLRSLESGVSLSWRAYTLQQLFSADLEAGISGLGAQLVNYSNPGENLEENFAIVRLHYVALKPFGDAWSLRGDAWAQHSPHSLPSIRQFKVGGGRVGRGFDAAALSGDRGLANKLELRRQMASGLPLADRLDAYLFYDIGSAWRHSSPGRESAASTGLGISIRSKSLAGYLELARPLTHADADGNREPGIFVELTSRFQ